MPTLAELYARNRPIQPLPSNTLGEFGSVLRSPVPSQTQTTPDFNRTLPSPQLPENSPGIIGATARTIGGGLGAVGNLLDLPGSTVRDALAFKNPFDQWLDPLGNHAESNRTTGRQLARQYGLAGDEDNYRNWWGGFGAEVLLDPLTYTGVGALTKAGQAAQKATGAISRVNLLKASRAAANDMAEATAKASAKGVGKSSKMTRVMRGIGSRTRVTPRMVIANQKGVAVQDELLKSFYAAGGTEAMLDMPMQSLLSFKIPKLLSKELTVLSKTAKEDLAKRSADEAADVLTGQRVRQTEFNKLDPTMNPARKETQDVFNDWVARNNKQVDEVADPTLRSVPSRDAGTDLVPDEFKPKDGGAPGGSGNIPLIQPNPMLADTPKLFHGSHEHLKELTNRDVETIDNIGTWVTSSPTSAASKYGPNVHAIEASPANLLEAHTSDFDDFFYANNNLFNKLFPGEPIATFKSFRENGLRTKNKRAWDMRKVYLQNFRGMLERAGYDGVVWKNSTIDAKKGAEHDVTLLFNKSPLKATELGSPSVVPKSTVAQSAESAASEVARVADSAGEVWSKPVFRGLSKNHAKFDDRISGLVDGGVLSPTDADLLRVAFSSASESGMSKLSMPSMEVVDTIPASNGLGGAAGKWSWEVSKNSGLVEFTIQMAKDRPKSQSGLAVLLHELGHQAQYMYKNIPGNSWGGDLAPLINRAMENDRLRQEFSGLHGEKLGEYLTHTFDEQFPQLFADSIIRRKIPQGAIGKIVTDVRDWIVQFLEKIKVVKSIPKPTQKRIDEIIDTLIFTDKNKVAKEVVADPFGGLSGASHMAKDTPQPNPLQWVDLGNGKKTLEISEPGSHSARATLRTQADGTVNVAVSSFAKEAGAPAGAGRSALRTIAESAQEQGATTLSGVFGTHQSMGALGSLFGKENITFADKATRAPLKITFKEAMKEPGKYIATVDIANLAKKAEVASGFAPIAGKNGVNFKATTRAFRALSPVHEAFDDNMDALIGGGKKVPRDERLRLQQEFATLEPQYREAKQRLDDAIADGDGTARIAAENDLGDIMDRITRPPELKSRASTARSVDPLTGAADTAEQAAKTAEVKASWIEQLKQSMPENTVSAVADVIDRGGDLFYATPAGNQVAALFRAELYGRTTEIGRGIGRARHQAVQNGIDEYRQILAPVVRTIHESKLFDDRAMVEGGLTATQATDKLNANANLFLDYMEGLKKAPEMPDEFKELVPQMDIVKGEIAKARERLEDAGFKAPKLDDLFLGPEGYFPRIKATGSKSSTHATARINPRTGSVIEESTRSMRARDELYRDNPGGTSVINEMSTDPNLSGLRYRADFVQKKLNLDDLSAPIEMGDGSVMSLREYIAENYGDRLFKGFDATRFDRKSTQFDKMIKALADLDPMYAEEQIPLFGRNPMASASQHIEDSVRVSFMGKFLQQMYGKSAVHMKYSTPQHISITEAMSKNDKWNDKALVNIIDSMDQEVQNVYHKNLVDSVQGDLSRLTTMKKKKDGKFERQHVRRKVDGKEVNLKIINGKEVTRVVDGKKVRVIEGGGLVSYGTREERKATPTGILKEEKVFEDAVDNDYLYRFAQGEVAGKFLDEFGVDADIVKEAQGFMKPFSEPEELGAIEEGARRFINVMKAGLTAPWPAFHMRNAISAFYMNATQGVQDPRNFGKLSYWKKFAQPYADAYKIRSNNLNGLDLDGINGLSGSPEEKLKQFQGEMFSMGIIGDKLGLAAEHIGDSASNMASQYPGLRTEQNPLKGIAAALTLGKSKLGSPGQYFSKPPVDRTTIDLLNPVATKGGYTVELPKKADVPKLTDRLKQAQVKNVDTDLFAGAHYGRDIASFTEDMNRMSPYIAARRNGYSPQAARDLANKLQVDYSNLSAFESKKMRLYVPFYCVPTDHEILTKRGWKKHSELVVGEDVLAYDVESGTTAWKPLLEVAEFDFDGELMQWQTSRKGKKINFQFTDDHRWPIQVVKKEYIKHADREDHGALKVARYKSVGHTRKIVRANEIPDSASLIGAAPLGEDCESILSDRLATILGWVVTDGYFRWRGNYCEMMVYQSPKKHLDEIVELLGTKPRKPHPTSGVVCVPVALADVKEINKVFSEKKDLINIVTNLSRSAASAMIEAMDKGESSYTNSNLHFAQDPSYNPHVLEAYQILRTLNGQVANIGKIGCAVRNRTRYKWSKESVSRVPYTGKIWCPRTSLGTWVMRHNGCVVITGNTFTRGMLPTVIEDLIRNPGGAQAITIKAANRSRDPNQVVPDHIAQTAAIPFGSTSDGSQRYLTGFGLPFEDTLNLLNGPLRGDLTDTLREIGGRSNPFIKGAAEQAFGRSLFQDGPMGGRELTDLDPPVGRTISNVKDILTGSNTKQASPFPSQMGEFVVSNSPLSRFATTARTLTDKRKWETKDAMVNPLTGLGLNLLTGVRVNDVSPQAQDAILNDRLARALKDLGGRTFSRPYVSDEREASMTAEEKRLSDELLEGLKRLQERFKGRREQKEKAEAASALAS